MILRKLLMITCGMLFRAHKRNTRIIDMLGSGRVKVNGLGYDLWKLW